MTPEPSSTFSSEPAPPPGTRAGSHWNLRDAAWFGLGCVSVLIAFDLLAGALASVPADAREPSGELQRYLNYGESIEAKLDRAVGGPGEEAIGVVRSGWVPTELYPPGPDWQEGGTRVAVYGMSFARRIAYEMKDLDPTLATVRRSGPAAPLSHSYALIEADPVRPEADLVVLGILSSSIPYLQALSGLGFTLENPAPYTFPKFILSKGELVRRDPVIRSRDEFFAAYRDRSPRWQEHLAELRRHDAYWDSFLFEHSIADRSVLAKFVRRAWSARNIDRRRAAVYSAESGYDVDHPSIAAVPLLLRSIRDMCLRDGQQLTVVLLHELGEPGHLARWLRPHLEGMGVEVISSTDFFSSLDASNFEPDGHYVPARDRELARAVIASIRK